MVRSFPNPLPRKPKKMKPAEAKEPQGLPPSMIISQMENMCKHLMNMLYTRKTLGFPEASDDFKEGYDAAVDELQRTIDINLKRWKAANGPEIR